jgi:exosortase/archaeosortase family protein
VANGLRVAGTGIAAHYIGPAAATGFFHSFSGWLVFMTSFGLLLLVAGALKRLPSFDMGQPQVSLT